MSDDEGQRTCLQDRAAIQRDDAIRGGEVIVLAGGAGLLGAVALLPCLGALPAGVVQLPASLLLPPLPQLRATLRQADGWKQ